MDDSKSQLSESEESEPQSPTSPCKKEKKASSKNKSNIVLNVSDCQYSVVRKVSKELGWKRQKTAETMDWDVCWTDNAVQPETLTKMELHQKINHFPGMYNLARKNLLGRGLMRMRKKFPEEFDFFPLTWMLPVEYHELRTYFEGKAKGKARTFIVKPECLSQGKGIFLTRKLQDINPANHCVVQRYMHKPYLIDGLKFDLRVYVLVTSVDPLTLYLYEEGLGRFATEKYEAPTRQNMDEVCMHLTNYAINKDNPKFVFNQSEKDMSKGHKRSLTAVYEMLKSQGIDTDKLKQKIKDCIIKTMISGLPHLTNTYKSCQPQSHASNMCFELLGFDVMLNEKAEPSILEINHTPSFSTDTPLDYFIKFNYIKDALTIMNINEKNKNQIIRTQKQACQQRVMTGKKVKLTLEEREARKKEAVLKKLKFQKKNLGRFERIYPTQAEIDPYKKFMDFADQMYQISVGGKRVKREQKTQQTKTSIIRPKPKKQTTLSTTPDLINRKPIAQRKYNSKQSLNLIQGENHEEKDQIENKEAPLTSKPYSAGHKAPLQSEEVRLKTSKNEKTGDKVQFQQIIFSKTPNQQFLNNFTNKNRADVFNDREFTREFRSIRKVGGGSVRDEGSEKYLGGRDKDKIFSRPKPLVEKIPITLNTLLINGIEQNTNFLVGNLKKYVISKNGRAQ